MPESSEERQLPAEGFGKLLDVSSTINVMIKFVFLEGWLWWPWESWTGQLLSMPEEQHLKISYESTNSMLGITRLPYPLLAVSLAWNCSPGG